MKHLILGSVRSRRIVLLLFLLFLAACGEDPQPVEFSAAGSGAEPVATPRVLSDRVPSAPSEKSEENDTEREDSYNLIYGDIMDKVEAGKSPAKEDLAKIQAIIGQYGAWDQVQILRGCSGAFLRLVPDLVLSACQRTMEEASTFSSGNYAAAIDLLSRLGGGDAANMLLQEMDKVPKFNYPETPPNLFHGAFRYRGVEGYVVEAIIRSSDPAAKDVYWRKLESEESEDRTRVFLFGLRQSCEVSDIRRLASKYEEEGSEVVRHDIAITMNWILRNISNEGEQDPQDFEASQTSLYPNSPSSSPVLEDRRRRIESVAATREEALSALEKLGIYDDALLGVY